MLAFVRGEHDCLVATTIIESGLDIPTANTLIVERADQLGLAQAYQIRGRVGPQPRARLRLHALPLARGADRRRRRAAVDALRQHRARLGLPRRDARPRDPRRRQPARRRAVGPRRRGRLRALLPDARGRGRGAARGRRGGEGRPTSASRSASTSTSTHTCRPTTSPSRRRRSTSTAESPRPRERGELRALREELEDRFGPLPEPVANLLELQRARIELGGRGRAGSVEFRAGACGRRRSSSTPRPAATLRERARGRIYEWRERTLAVPVPDEPGARLGALLALAEGLSAAKALPAAA